MKNNGMGYGDEIPQEVYDIAAQLIRLLGELDEEYTGEGRYQE